MAICRISTTLLPLILLRIQRGLMEDHISRTQESVTCPVKVVNGSRRTRKKGWVTRGRTANGFEIPYDMHNLNRILIGVGVICLLLLAASCHSVLHSTFRSSRSQCQRNLRSLKTAVEEYPYDNDGQRPITLDEALSNIGFGDAEKSSRMLRCPGIKNETVRGTDVASRTGYCYIDWSKWFGRTNVVPNTFPLLYDRALQNHEGKGVNVVLVDGTIFWDAEGCWLRDFAAKHPEYQLPTLP